MSHSYRRTPKCGLCICDSEKPDKIIWHQRMRAEIRQCLHDADPDEVFLPDEREVSNEWSFGKDGKRRFDPREQPELMRK